jgi:ABC-type phosphate transport system ATPase subunit
VTFDIFCGENIAMIDDNSTTVGHAQKMILGFYPPDTHTTIEKEKVMSILKVFGRDITELNKYHLRLRTMHIPDNPPIFTGRLRDNIDPFRLFLDEEIVRVLHYFGFYKAYSSFAMNSQIANIEGFIEKIDNGPGFTHDVKRVFLGKKAWYRRMMNFKGSHYNDDEDQVNRLADLPPVVYYSTPNVKNAKVLRKFKMIVKIIITFKRLLDEVRLRERVIYEDIKMSKEINKQGFKSLKNKKIHEHRVNIAAKPILRSIYKASHEANENKYADDDKKCALLKYYIKNSNEKAVLHKLLGSLVSNDSKQCSVNMRRIIYLTRVVLERPDLLVLDEDALMLDEPSDPGYLDSVFSVLRGSTLICRMQSFKLVHRFDKCATFSGSRLAEFDRTRRLITDADSYTAMRIYKADARKLPLAALRKYAAERKNPGVSPRTSPNQRTSMSRLSGLSPSRLLAGKPAVSS